ncbi:ATP-binding cassette domain-containing protein [Paenibacillus medicaginis]|uniref:ATP-binding cassette domain-containing protein n=1 Tax=Paenibacillus medicaginis TaxID=1470560 RepID=A0ABV5C3B5_9BACL
MSDMIRTRNLTKQFGGSTVISGVNMTVKEREIYGFLGSNGAGKTTVMRMLLNLIKPTEGEIELFGERLTAGATKPFKRIGHIIETPVFYENLTGQRNLELHCEYMGMYNPKMIQEALELVQLNSARNKPVHQYSLGMKQRLGIARAVSTKPELLILDEPINGLDPNGILEMRSLFKRLRDEYRITLLISSHILGEIEQIADTIGVINSGRLIEEVSMERIRSTQTEYVEIITLNVNRAAYVLEHDLNIRNFKVSGDRQLKIYDMQLSQSELSRQLITREVPIEAINRRSRSLEEYFLEAVRGGEEHAASH